MSFRSYHYRAYHYRNGLLIDLFLSLLPTIAIVSMFMIDNTFDRNGGDFFHACEGFGRMFDHDSNSESVADIPICLLSDKVHSVEGGVFCDVCCHYRHRYWNQCSQIRV